MPSEFRAAGDYNASRGFVGVFDSGLGGLSVLSELVGVLPAADFEYVGDSANAPYGTKTAEFVLGRSLEICEDFVNRGAGAIVIACNTATSIAARTLREKYTIPIVGMEPAVKPAFGYVKERRTTDGRPLKIAVLATPMTLAEEKYKTLVTTLGAADRVVEVPSPELVELVENHLLDEEKVRRFVDAFVRAKLERIEGLGAIVLGCTHFVFLRRHFEERLDGIEVFDGNHGTALRLRSLLEGKAPQTPQTPPEPSDNSPSLISSAISPASALFRGRIVVRNTAGEEMSEYSKKLLKYEMSRGVYGKVEGTLRELVSSKLDDADQKFAKMYYIEKRPASEIAKALGISEKKLLTQKERVGAILFRNLRNI